MQCGSDVDVGVSHTVERVATMTPRRPLPPPPGQGVHYYLFYFSSAETGFAHIV